MSVVNLTNVWRTAVKTQREGKGGDQVLKGNSRVSLALFLKVIPF